MANEPDSEAEDFESIEVTDTPERDNPKFGAVSLQVSRGIHSTTIRMTKADAEKLAIKITKYLISKESN